MIFSAFTVGESTQNGEAMAENKNVMLKTIPTTYSGGVAGNAKLLNVEGKKGITGLKAAPVRKQPSQSDDQVSFPVYRGVIFTG